MAAASATLSPSAFAADKERVKFRGVTYGYYARNGFFSTPEAAKDVERIAGYGIEWVCLVATVMQEAYHSTRQFRDFRMTPGDDELIDIINLFHKKGVKVMLRPMLESWDGTQRAHIHLPQGCVFEDRPYHYRQDWFENYKYLTRHYVRIAAKTGCEGYCLDSELNQLVPYTEEWMGIIEEVRKNYSGHLTTSISLVISHLDKIKDKKHWFYALDSLGTSFYHGATKYGDHFDPNADFDAIMKQAVFNQTADEMAGHLCRVLGQYREFAKLYGKPLYMSEVGCCSAAGASMLPGYWRNPYGYDGEEQANYLRAIIKTFDKEDWWSGLFWWKWDERNARPQYKGDPRGDKGFIIDGKPAAQVFRDWSRGR